MRYRCAEGAVLGAGLVYVNPLMIAGHIGKGVNAVLINLDPFAWPQRFSDEGANAVETVENGSYQPLSRPVFIYVNVKAIEKPEVKEFVEFYLKNALLLVKEAKFFPLPPRAYTTMLEHFNKKRTGSVFSGVPAIGLTIDELIRREDRLQYENF